ncbi:hypothetical protein [Spirosoma flavum]|uniref:Uncharacterized protein n=1 Tax=Spirosoma flavum TaxID=2048557 RepID=A0ABW6ALM7_9BACT
MREPKYYSLDDILDFGEDYKGRRIKDILSENRNRIDFYFKEVDWFLMADDLLIAFAGNFSDVMIPEKGSLTGKAMKYKDYLPIFNEEKLKRFYEKYPDFLKNKKGLWRPGDRNTFSRNYLSQLNKDAFSDGDGTEEWSFSEE